MTNDFLCPVGGEGAAHWVPGYSGEPGGPGQDGGAAPPPQRREPPGNHDTHQSHLRLQTDRGMGTTINHAFSDNAKRILFIRLSLNKSDLFFFILALVFECKWRFFMRSPLVTRTRLWQNMSKCSTSSPLTSPLYCFNPHHQPPPLCPALPLWCPSTATLWLFYFSCFLDLFLSLAA